MKVTVPTVPVAETNESAGITPTEVTLPEADTPLELISRSSPTDPTEPLAETPLIARVKETSPTEVVALVALDATRRSTPTEVTVALADTPEMSLEYPEPTLVTEPVAETPTSSRGMDAITGPMFVAASTPLSATAALGET